MSQVPAVWSQRARQLRRRATSRRLFVEPLEERRVLAPIDIGIDFLPVESDEGSPINLVATFDDPAEVDNHVAQINWGDGTITPGIVDHAANTVSGTHTYLNQGEFTVTISIVSGAFDEGEATGNITVNNVLPVVTPLPDLTVAERDATPFVLATFFDPGVLDVHVATIDWGDGSLPTAAVIDQGLSTISGGHLYNVPGSYNGSITINDGDGPDVVQPFTITVTNVPPNVLIDGPFETVRARPTPFFFSTDEQAFTPDAQVVYNVDWDGDGIIDATYPGTASGIEVVHTFAIENNFNVVRVTATDEFGDTGPVAEHFIEVKIFALLENEDGFEDLVIGGTHFADRIVLQRLSNGAVQARINSNFYRLPDTAGKIIVYGGEGSDHITVSQSLLYDFELYGGPGNDYIAGGRYDDIIDGGEGNDRLLARSGNNIFYGGDGNDVIRGGVGDDIAFGGAGRDIIYGGDGNDVLVGGDGNDMLRGERGDDILLGGDGNDVLWGGQGHDLLDGGAGNDVLYGNAGRDILIGGFGADSLFGGADDDALIGGFVDFGIDPDDEEDPDSFELYLEELYMLLQDWLIPGSLQDRIEFVSDRIGPDVVVEDNARDAMWGGSGQDWFVTDGRDLVRDKRAGDIINDGFDDDFFGF